MARCNTLFTKRSFPAYRSLPSCYGFVEDPSGGGCLAGLRMRLNDVFSSHSSNHRTLAARWLAHLHTWALRVTATARLPDRGPDYYLKHLRLARDTIERAVVDSALSPDELVVLKWIVSQYGAVEASWSKVEKFCDRMPRNPGPRRLSPVERKSSKRPNGNGSPAL